MTLLSEMEKRQGHASPNSRNKPSDADEADIKRGYAIIVSMMMFVVHATLSALAHLEYGQETTLWIVCKDAWPSIPVFWGLTRVVSPLKSWYSQVSGAGASIIIGCRLVYLVNEEGYYASMQMAPALGSLWVWLFLELEWYSGVTSLGAVALYLYANGYSIVN